MQKVKIFFLILFVSCLTAGLSTAIAEKRSPVPAKKAATPKKNLIIEEYKLFSANKIYEVDCSEPGSCVPKASFKNREKWRNINYIQEYNNTIKPLGYRFAKEKSRFAYELYKGTNLIFSGLTDIRGFNENASKTKFMFTADYGNESYGTDGPTYQTGGTGLFVDMKFNKSPLTHTIAGMYYLGEQIIKIEPSKKTGAAKYYKYSGKQYTEEVYEIYLDNKSIYEFAGLDFPNAVLQAFYVYNEHWILEYSKPEINGGRLVGSYGTVVVDGKNLNDKNHYTEMFSHGYIKDELFYFFRDKKGGIRISYAGKTLPDKYDEVMHYSGGFYVNLNPAWNRNMISFYGLKNNFWYYVEAGIYE